MSVQLRIGADTLVGLEGDLLDAVVLGPQLPLGTRLRVKAGGAVTLTDRGMSDDKLICSAQPLRPSERHSVLRFFGFYARCKALLNFWRRRPGALSLRWLVRGHVRALAGPRARRHLARAAGRILVEQTAPA